MPYFLPLRPSLAMVYGVSLLKLTSAVRGPAPRSTVLPCQGVLMNIHMNPATVERGCREHALSGIPTFHTADITLWAAATRQWTPDAAERAMLVFNLQRERGSQRRSMQILDQRRERSIQRKALLCLCGAAAWRPVAEEGRRLAGWTLWAGFSTTSSCQPKLQNLWLIRPRGKAIFSCCFLKFSLCEACGHCPSIGVEVQQLMTTQDWTIENRRLELDVKNKVSCKCCRISKRLLLKPSLSNQF